MRDEKKIELNEKERKVKIIEEGKKSDYWKLLEEKLQQWIKKEDEYLNKFKYSGLKNRNIEWK